MAGLSSSQSTNWESRQPRLCTASMLNLFWFEGQGPGEGNTGAGEAGGSGVEASEGGAGASEGGTGTCVASSPEERPVESSSFEASLCVLSLRGEKGIRACCSGIRAAHTLRGSTMPPVLRLIAAVLGLSRGPAGRLTARLPHLSSSEPDKRETFGKAANDLLRRLFKKSSATTCRLGQSHSNALKFCGCTGAALSLRPRRGIMIGMALAASREKRGLGSL
eukprot:CAMPEP_0177489042 /NCGR_PEP_ID=MMETSP0369-20130122/30484_1 /TAXON_ID=447022 ORGANISM="Scrippsiella hangoei-like, Strain SHHI-4" /NCGR_SAMPLE_ID=MMETSP0369 /ASSEMBLY_ACC=CAM_ASM_000364 /LENGTH=220 /DNA_ID=CAMNT_0018965463 /DNA_START=305 /DNA_END=963 /DNA_ORIENTATION=+